MRAFVLAVVLGALALPADAQTLWSRPYEPNQLAVEALLPDVENASPLSGATFVNLSGSLNENVEVLAELPLARFQPSGSGPTSSTIGNPYLGLGLSSTSLPVLVQLGARIPAASANAAAAVGDAADIGRTRAFRPDEFSVSGLANGRLSLGRGSSLRLRTGLAFASREAPRPDRPRIQDWFLHYDAQIWREGGLLLTGLSLTGRALLNSPGTTDHQLTLSVMGDWERVQPGLLIGTSLNDLALDGEFTPVAGLTLSLSYGRFSF
jgi:hypothetical protein